jgi:hypothetical protein
MPRREFSLPPGDVEYLDAQYPGWEAIKNGTVNWLLLGQFTVPSGYTVATTQVALRVEPGYPDTQLDMAYFHPALRRHDGKAIAATESTESIDSKTFQRWSRHRTAENPWRPGVDDVSTHLAQVQHWMVREFQK